MRHPRDKGCVERAVQTVRDDCFAGEILTTLDDARTHATPSRTHYVVKRLRAAVPDLRILVGRWAAEALADDGSEELKADGATHVAAGLLDTRDYLAGLLDLPRVAVSNQPGIHAA